MQESERRRNKFYPRRIKNTAIDYHIVIDPRKSCILFSNYNYKKDNKRKKKKPLEVNLLLLSISCLFILVFFLLK